MVAQPLVDDSGRVIAPNTQPIGEPRRLAPKGLIWAAVGIGAIAAGIS